MQLSKKITAGFFSAVAVGVVFLSNNVVFAAAGCADSEGYHISLPFNGTTHYCNFTDYFVGLMTWAIGIAQILAVIMILWGAFKYSTSGGDQSKIKEGKDIIIGALVGFALLLLIKVLIPIIGV